MTQYLLAAEADKIQDFVFRSSRLREVVGGSQLLSRFCKDVPFLLKPDNTEMEVVINAGGSFRILFDDEERAKEFGANLAEVYRRATGSSLTVAELVEVIGIDDFDKANEMAEDNLRKAKRWREGWQSQEHMPYIAFCSSCGIGLATTYATYHKSEDKQYLCVSCLNKSAEREGHEHAEELGPFLGAFYKEVIKEPALASWPGKEERNGRSKKDPTEDIADYDPRRYVAYLLADGNAMGEVFGKCKDPDKMQKLSNGLTQAMHHALAVPTKKIMGPSDDLFIPVLPLILGGDDLFALIPAPWALDFADQFCRVFEEEMDELINTQLGLNMPRPTVSVAVVICKSKHPYKLAHEAGETKLKDAKRIGKRIKLAKNRPYSTVHFEVVLGGRLVSEMPSKEIRPTLRPYLVIDNDESEWGLSLQRLIEQRWELRGIPNKRLSELQSLYDLNNLPDCLDNEKIAPWESKLDRLLMRINQRNEVQAKKIETTLKLLGESNSPYLREVSRYPDSAWYGHGLPDLLEAWDFAMNLDKDRKAYEVVG
jgi:hypothetical protein